MDANLLNFLCLQHMKLLTALQTKLIGFRSNLDPDQTISCDYSNFDRSNNHMTTLTKISKNPHWYGLQNQDFKI